MYIWSLLLLLSTFLHEWSRFLKYYSIKSVLTSMPYMWLVMQPNPISQFRMTDKARWNLSFLDQVSLRQVSLCLVMLCHDRLMNLMLHGLIMDGHNSLNFKSLSLVCLFVNILYIWTIITAEHVLTRMITTNNAFYELVYIINFDLYTVSMILFVTTEHNVTISHVIYIWTLNFTADHVLPRMVTPWKAL
jgi:hypothetical protein